MLSETVFSFQDTCSSETLFLTTSSLPQNCMYRQAGSILPIRHASLALCLSCEPAGPCVKTSGSTPNRGASLESQLTPITILSVCCVLVWYLAAEAMLHMFSLVASMTKVCWLQAWRAPPQRTTWTAKEATTAILLSTCWSTVGRPTALKTCEA